MDGGRRGEPAADFVPRSASVAWDRPAPLEALRAALGPGPFAAVLMFVTPSADFAAIAAAAPAVFPGAEVAACTTAGEITDEGYAEGRIVALGLPAGAFAAATLTVTALDRFSPQEVIGRVVRRRADLAVGRGAMEHEFAFTMIDGLSLKEDELAGAFAAALGEVPLFGGSAGDGTRFAATRVAVNGQAYDNAAVLVLVRSICPVRVFSLDHLVPTDRRMVVTSADPGRRLVHTLNAEPAAREYARIVGKDPAQLSPFTFAAHPVAVRLGGRHHVRAIQRVTEAGDLVFFSAIDEGLVLTVTEPQDMALHLERELAALGRPQTVLACDCILRRLEAGESQQTRALSAIMARHNVVGFSTYGEQLGPMHVNQTMTGVAIYPPEGG